ncbi:MAG: nucleotidyltransferase [Parcubacteria group bacterium Licking1014_1]|nr:MAG: nucleotidyltransferase [Parcubacteria group bacterium Licking1014_1]
MINFTKNQTLILELFFRDPEKSYYFRQIGTLLNKEPGVFQKDIETLVKNHVLKSEYRANSRFFELNKDHPLFEEFKSIFFKTLGAEGKLKEIFKDIKNVKITFIFGSYARKEENSLSDIDLMIIGNPNEDDFFGKISDLESKLSREINYRIFSEYNWQKRIREKESFILSILKNPKIFIIGNENELRKID